MHRRDPPIPPLRAVGSREEARKGKRGSVLLSRLKTGGLRADIPRFGLSAMRSDAIQDATRFGRRAIRASILTTARDASDPRQRLNAGADAPSHGSVDTTVERSEDSALMMTSDNICTGYKVSGGPENNCGIVKIYGPQPRRLREGCKKLSGMDTPEKLPLPDLYLIDARKLLAEVDRVGGLALAIPPSAASHSAVQSVVDALWHLRRDMEDILQLQASIHNSFAEKALQLSDAAQPPRVGLRVVS